LELLASFLHYSFFLPSSPPQQIDRQSTWVFLSD
jgi:hypothetical protein